MNFCDYPTCPGGHHKFPSCVAEALWCASLEGADETTGDCDFRGHHALMILAADEVLVADGPRFVTVPSGCYVVTTVSSGAVWLTAYDSEDEARGAFGSEQESYHMWLSGVEA